MHRQLAGNPRGKVFKVQLLFFYDFLRSEQYPARSGTGITQRANSEEGISETMRSLHEVPVSANGQNVNNK